ncbi:hypothetical protein LTR92_005096 [Exophiala xenobiotica]|nr:hypothetical protein LTR92_005096 [Exophiala xenobiotica]
MDSPNAQTASFITQNAFSGTTNAKIEARFAQASQDQGSSEKRPSVDAIAPPAGPIQPSPDGGERLNPSSNVSNVAVPYNTANPDYSCLTPFAFRDVDLDFWDLFTDAQVSAARMTDMGQPSNMMVDYTISESWEDVIQEQPLSRISSVTSVGSRKTKPSSASQSPSSNHGFNTDSFEQVTQSSEDDITQQVTRRLGRMCLAEDGHMRYYGATSHFSMLPNDLRTLYPTDTRSLREEGETMIQRAHLGWIRDHEYELHLTALYFAWHNTFVNEVRKDVYFHEKELYYSGYDTPLFSPALENAILAIGALYSARQHSAIQESASDLFGARTRLYLEVEMDRPTIATTQAATILSAFESANGHDSRGWIYSGIAVQMTTDLGLHLHLDTKDSQLCPDEDTRGQEHLRRSLFWTVYAADMFHSTYSGRPYLLNKLRYDVPCVDVPDKGDWQPFHADGTPMILPSNFDGSAIESVKTHVTQMAIKLRKIYDSIYCGNGSTSEGAMILVPPLALQFQQWKASLPAALQVDYSKEQSHPAPAPIVLQLQ